MDPFYLKLLLAYEDKRFYDHNGVDPRALLRAAWQTLRNGRVTSGASTLTMQVARLLEESGTGQIGSKLRQIRLALALERHLSKDEILALYLHLAPYGGNVEGIRAATLAYFGKEPRRLTPAEAALLVAIPQSPEARRPDRAAPNATAARARVLARALGDGLIDADQSAAAQTDPSPPPAATSPALAPHLSDRVIAEEAGTHHQTTLDRDLQTQPGTAGRRYRRGSGGAVAGRHRGRRSPDSEVLASVGSAAYKADQRQGFVDMTTALPVPRIDPEAADLWSGL